MTIQKEFQTGRSMVEMLAVIMIIGVLTVGALAGFTQAMQKFNVGKMHNDIQSISSEVVNLYAWQRGYPDSTDASFQTTLCGEDIFPDGCDENGVALNPFGGKYTVTTDPSEQTLTIVADGLPEEACQDLTIQEWAYVAEETEPSCNDTTFTITFE